MSVFTLPERKINRYDAAQHRPPKSTLKRNVSRFNKKSSHSQGRMIWVPRQNFAEPSAVGSSKHNLKLRNAYKQSPKELRSPQPIRDLAGVLIKKLVLSSSRHDPALRGSAHFDLKVIRSRP